ncbi:GtrA-like protein [Sulfitobacter marinus]|uniref:GtrA-like protein n=1 Tax=Sulfitobacter marinus TaxID=394264 RepID=A0A1I6T8V7_9RHOB|nr:GtrA family protein [Sulfitobacter marinus]SFS85652.1 GtrA-like protein [Sulfitobacter marinus]
MPISDYKLVRFCLIGSSTALAYVLLYMAFLAMDVSQVLANGFAFVLAVMLQYVGQAAFTFGRPLNDFGQILRFGVMVVLGFVSSALITSFLPDLMELTDWAAAVIAALYLPVQNFVFMALWVFALPLSRTEITS